MKKITLKISAFLLLALFTFQVQGQEVPPLDGDGYGFYNTLSDGTWKVKLKDQVSGETLFLTVDNNLKAVWTTELPGDDETQLWIFTEYAPASSNYSIATAVSVLPGQVLKADLTSTGLTPDLIVGAAGAQDEWQMRKFANVEPDYTSNGQLPGQNAILLASDRTGTPWEAAPNAVRLGTTPAKDATIKLDQSAYALRFKLIQALSTEAFDASSIFIANPVKNELSVKGLTSNISQVAIYSLLGQEVLSRKLNGESSLNLDISALTSGMYIVDFKGENGSLTKKIVKQ